MFWGEINLFLHLILPLFSYRPNGGGRPYGSSPSQQRAKVCLLAFWISKTLALDLIACIDKWVNSKFEDATPPGLCSGPKLAIWNKNQPPRPEKTPGHGEKSKMAILVLFGSRRSLGEKETDLYNDSCPTVFNLYDICTPQTPARHP